MNTFLLKNVSRKLNLITIKHNLFQFTYIPLLRALTSVNRRGMRVDTAAHCKRNPLNCLSRSPEFENHFLVFKINKLLW